MKKKALIVFLLVLLLVLVIVLMIKVFSSEEDTVISGSLIANDQGEINIIFDTGSAIAFQIIFLLRHGILVGSKTLNVVLSNETTIEPLDILDEGDIALSIPTPEIVMENNEVTISFSQLPIGLEMNIKIKKKACQLLLVPKLPQSRVFLVQVIQ